jgi:hypothetical protein
MLLLEGFIMDGMEAVFLVLCSRCKRFLCPSWGRACGCRKTLTFLLFGTVTAFGTTTIVGAVMDALLV